MELLSTIYGLNRLNSDKNVILTFRSMVRKHENPFLDICCQTCKHSGNLEPWLNKDRMHQMLLPM
jgi:hypothetical protein